jgi:hypothetical protein
VKINTVGMTLVSLILKRSTIPSAPIYQLKYTMLFILGSVLENGVLNEDLREEVDYGNNYITEH